MVLRNEYLEKLRSWKDEQVIKVVTGIPVSYTHLQSPPVSAYRIQAVA